MFLTAAYEEMGLPLYIIDLESYEVIYINKEGKKLFGDIAGIKCHEVLNGTDCVCEACLPVEYLEENGSSRSRSRVLANVGKSIDTYESIVTLPDGRRGRLCVIVDMTEHERIQRENKAKDKARRDMRHLIDIQSGFISSAKSMMSAATLDGEMIFANRTMCETLGYSQEEILLLKINDFHPPEVTQEFVGTYIPFAIEKGEWKGDSYVIKKDGSLLPVRMIVFPIKGESGQLIATAAIMDDISEVLQLELMNRYQIAIMDSSTNYIGVSDLEGNTMYHSPGAYRMLGYEPFEAEQWDKRAIHPDWYIKRIINEGIPTAMQQGQWKARGELFDRHGNIIPIEQTIFPVFDQNHQPMGNATIISDITEQVKQEKEIEEARRMLRAIIDTAPSAIFWKDCNSIYIGGNKQFAVDAGVGDPDELIGKSDYELYPKELADKYVEADRRIFETGEEMLHVEELVTDKNGAKRWDATSKVLLRDEDDKPYALLGIYDDITKIKQNETKLEQAILAAEQANRAKGDFLSRMSHEIRTPMNAIKGLAELMALTELNSVQLNYVRNIVKSSNSLLSIINDVLDFSKINENKIEFVEGNYLLADLISEVSNVVSLRAAEKGLMLIVDMSPSLPKGLIGDDVRVKQVIINILNNAVKYTPEGHVIMHLSCEPSEDGIVLVCAVEDTGIGIREEDIPFLFEAFSQADRRVNHNIQGTGLGLSISDRLTRNMGGSISVESEYGVGSTFTVRIPQRVGNPEPIAAVADAAEKRVLLLEGGPRATNAEKMFKRLGIDYTVAATEQELNTLHDLHYTHCVYDSTFTEITMRRLHERMPDCVFVALKDMRFAMGQSGIQDAVLFIPLLITELVKVVELKPGEHNSEVTSTRTIDDFALVDTHVLVVDDNDINLIVSGEILRAYKAEVTCAESGAEALELCSGRRYDLIFMDHMMPGMDGVETTLALRESDGPNKNTPVIALTANVVNDMASYYLQNGMDDFISKPIEIEHLHRVLFKWLPSSKIGSLEEALQPKEPETDERQETSMEQLVHSLDAFGMYVSDVMREIENDYDVYIRRMDRIRIELAPLVEKLREEVRNEQWEEFAADVAEMGAMIHDVGARDCSGRARKLSNAAREGNADYVKSDFFSLMDNMYMLEKKMEVAVPLALGSIKSDVPFGDMAYCCDRLADLAAALEKRDTETSAALLDCLAHYSLDHALDIILVGISARLVELDFAGALLLHADAVRHCDELLKT